jgi:glutaredoxin
MELALQKNNLFMKTIDIYFTPQCGFCQILKSKLDAENISYNSHNITQDEKAFTEMQELTGGVMSVPVTVLDKKTKIQQLLIGYPDSMIALGFGADADMQEFKTEEATLTCPECNYQQKRGVPTVACVSFYVCNNCKKTIKSLETDCCVFCSYADKPCPLIPFPPQN